MNLIGTLSLEGDGEWLEYSVLEGSCRKEAVSAFLDALAREARRRKKEVVMVLDNAPFHTAKMVKGKQPEWERARD